MSIDRHIENRQWAFEALDELQAFLDDPDFEGEPEEQRLLLERKRIELIEGKYRVVFLGAFNVGKSTMINAFLGDEYLPTILEECTTKITHVVRDEDLRTVLRLQEPATPEEIDSLTRLLDTCGIAATVSHNPETNEVVIAYGEDSPSAMRQSLKALTTVNAEDDFPQLRPLREKFEELYVRIPNDRLQEDIALVDSPGVYSISETNKRIAQEIIPHSHLVVCLLDSQNAGNEQNREFIERIIKHRHRKVFFVINKSDQLNQDEIDVQGHRGPAKDLFRSLEGIVENPELFFVSSLYALISGQLAQRRLSIEELDANNKVKIPFSVQRNLVDSDDPAQGAAAFLLEKSEFDTFKDRLLDYLYTENREGAIVESVCRFLDGLAWKYARPIEVKLEMARNVPRLDELRRIRERLEQQVQEREREARAIQERFRAMSEGGNLDGRTFPGYEAFVDQQLSKEVVQRAVLDPIKQWLLDDEKFRMARRNEFKPLTGELETKLNLLVEQVQRELNGAVASIESDIGQRSVGGRLGDSAPVEALRAKLEPVTADLGKSYMAYAALGLIVGGMVGAAGGAYYFGSLVEEGALIFSTAIEATAQSGAGVGGAIGALAGLIIGLIGRSATSAGALREELSKKIDAAVEQALYRGLRDNTGATAPAVRDQLINALAKRRADFGAALKAALDKKTAEVQRELDAVRAEEDELRAEQERVINRLEPKLEKLTTLSGIAREIAEFNVPELEREVAASN